MASLRPHRHFNFVGLWKYGFVLSCLLIVLSIAGLVTSFVTTGSPLTLGTEFSGGTSIQINNTGDMTEDTLRSAFDQAATDTGIEVNISSLQTSTSANTGNGFIVKTTDTNSSNANTVMEKVEENLSLASDDVQIETIGASWGASVIWRSLLAFLLSCVAILIVIAARYREPRMGVVALVTLFHDLCIVVGIYAWAGIFMHMEITSDVIAALLAIVGYSLYDTIVSFHRINMNASPQMKMSLKTCANMSVNQIFMRSLNTSITSILPVLFMLILGTDTLRDFAFAMFCGMVIGIYSTFAISTPLFTIWKIHDPQYKKLEEKYKYEVIQSPFTKEMMVAARKASKEAEKAAKDDAKKAAAEEKAAAAAKEQQAPAVEEAAAVAAAGAAEVVEPSAEPEAAVEAVEEAAQETPAETEPEVAAEPEVEDDASADEVQDLGEVELEITPEMLAELGIDPSVLESGGQLELELTPEQLEKLGIQLEVEEEEEEE